MFVFVLFSREQKDTFKSVCLSVCTSCLLWIETHHCSLPTATARGAVRSAAAPECVGRVMRRLGELKNHTQCIAESAGTAAG